MKADMDIKKVRQIERSAGHECSDLMNAWLIISPPSQQKYCQWTLDELICPSRVPSFVCFLTSSCFFFPSLISFFLQLYFLFYFQINLIPKLCYEEAATAQISSYTTAFNSRVISAAYVLPFT